MEKFLNATYASSLTNLCEVNSTFDTGVLRVCYTGKNRNGSFISEEAIKRSLPTIYNCPIVCNYDRETDTFGGHDMEVVSDDNGIRLVNITQPVGVIPESSKVWFDSYTEEDGTENTYLYAEVLIWKRQEAYRKIKEDGVVSHSMEIHVKDGECVDGVYVVKDFEFTAFALIGVEPCFESSALEMFSNKDFDSQFALMMQDLKDTTKQVFTSKEVVDIHPHNNSTEGGEKVLEEKMELIAKFGIALEELDFSIEDITIDELEAKLEAFKCKDEEKEEKKCEKEEEPEEDEPVADEGGAEDEDGSKENGEEDEKEDFALIGSILDSITRALYAEKMECEWGKCSRYCYIDADLDLKEVYAIDTMDEHWDLFGFAFEFDGDKVVIDFSTAKRKKWIIADFDEGEQDAGTIVSFKEISDFAWKEKYQIASDTIDTLNKELKELREFKADIEKSVEADKRAEVFAQFEDLAGVEAFEALREQAMDLSIADLEEKCYAIRGRVGSTKFSCTDKKPVIKVQKSEGSVEPYGGIFAKFGYDE